MSRFVRHHWKVAPGAMRSGLVAAALLAAGALRSIAQPGADLPWTRYEAEDCELVGGAVVEGPSRERGTFAAEASSRRCVRLGQAGDGIRFTATRDFDALVLRYAMPDAPTGGGTDDTLVVVIDGREFPVPVTSRYAWLYGDEAKNRGEFSNTPPSPGYTGPLARKRFDEVRHRFSATTRAGAQVTVRLPAGAASAWMYLDLVETEAVPPPIAPPSGFVSLTDPAFGLAPGAADASTAMEAALTAAKARRTGVFIPAGTFRFSRAVKVSDIAVQGAGWWHTTLWFTSAEPRQSGFIGGGGRITVADVSVTGSTTTRLATRGFSGWFGPGSVVRSVWVERVGAGAWIATYPGGPVTDGLVITHCRIRNTFADGINFARGTRNSVVEQTHVRGTMDDGLATWSSDLGTVGPTHGNVFRANTVENALRAGGIGIFGGGSHRVVDNVVADTMVGGGIRFSTTFPGHPFSSDGWIDVRDNVLIRCGGMAYQQKLGALSFEVVPIMGDIQHVRVVRCTITDATYFGIGIRGRSAKGTTSTIHDVSIEDTTLARSGETDLSVDGDAAGEIVLAACHREGGQPLKIVNHSRLRIFTR